ncbi:hypothetical protein [Bacillus cereus]|nr:hypothetical protein [Bacillus cereus]
MSPREREELEKFKKEASISKLEESKNKEKRLPKSNYSATFGTTSSFCSIL